MNINKGAEKIINILEANGYEAYAVGGCVRDTIMGKTPNDWDITTNCLPEDIVHCFEGVRIIETGLKHGTVTLLIDDETFEVTTYRKDGAYTDNRHPDSVTFVTDLESDLSRRDFTVNAMAYNPRIGLVDLFGGREDIENKCIRCVGEANKRFGEDALRILRALRFASVLNFTINEDTSRAIYELKDNLSNISKERINCEFTKLLTGKRNVDIIREYFDVICVFIPEMADMRGFKQHNSWHIYDVLEHTLVALSHANNDIIVRLALLLHDIAKPRMFTMDENGIGHFHGHPAVSADMAREILNRLRYDKNTISTVVRLIKDHDNRFPPNIKSVKRMMTKLGEENMRRLISIQLADSSAQNPERSAQRLRDIQDASKLIDIIVTQQQAYSINQLAVNGKDLIEMGIKPGPRLGEILEELLQLVIDDKLENTRDSLISQVLKYL